MNNVTLIGRVATEPTLTTTTSGTRICRLRLAIPKRKNEDGSDAGADFIDIISFNASADANAKFLKKGREIGVTGRLQQNTWTDDEGGKHERHEIVAQNTDWLQESKASQAAKETAS